MKKFIALISVAVLALGFTSAAHAANAISTQELIKDCKGKDGTFITCEIYGQAVYDTYLVTRNPKTAPDFICVQQPAPTRKEVIQEYVQWSDANPKYANDPAADTILRFLAGRFPCNKK
jgi:Rap1a immunity proteins